MILGFPKVDSRSDCASPDQPIDQRLRQTLLGDEEHVGGYDFDRPRDRVCDRGLRSEPGRRQRPGIVDGILTNIYWPYAKNTIFACRA
jgi:hypothetical protein